MKIAKNNNAPVKPGQRYFLDVVAAEIGGECDYFVLPSGSVLKLSQSSIKTLWTEAQPINRCKDCKHAVQSEMYARNVSCEYQHSGCCRNKMSKACKHFTPIEP